MNATQRRGPAQGAGGGDLLRDVPFLVVALALVALCCLLPAGHAAIHGDAPTAQAFFYSGLMLLVLAVMLGIATRGRLVRHPARDRLAMLLGTYLLLPPAMALPFGLSVPDTSWSNAWFEMLSSFTTTGATVYEPGRLPPSLHLWRGLCGWLGGFFTLLAAHTVLSPLNLGGAEVISGRVPGRGAGGQASRLAEASERLRRDAGTILQVYAGLTFALWVLLLMAGEDGLLALTHAMGTLSTSGISAGIGMAVTGSGLLGEVLIFGFLLIALSRRMMPMPGLVARNHRLRDDPELRLGLFLIALVVLVLMLRHALSDLEARDMETLPQFLRAFWGATFTAASFLTSTGYESAWWGSARDWAGLGTPGMLLLGLAIIGGGVATTAGGVKLLRVYALYMHGRRELERIIHPSSVGGKGADVRRLVQDGARMAWVFFMLFAISVAFIVTALTLAGKSFPEAIVLGLAALTTTGPLAVVAAETPLAFAGQTGVVKTILGVAMIVGRLEILALIALAAPGGWRGGWRR